MEKQITFSAGDIQLEGILSRRSPTHAAVIAHPHPLYGGDMHNHVVAIMAEAYQQLDWSTLRFNFRGTGASGGGFDDGEGEQVDLQAAIDCLQSEGFQQIDLAGYSFGAWIICRWARQHGDHGHRIFLVSPPVAFLDFTGCWPIAGLNGAITGDRDDIAPRAMIQTQLAQWHPEIKLHVIEQADHFYGGKSTLLRTTLNQLVVAAHR